MKYKSPPTLLRIYDKETCESNQKTSTLSGVSIRLPCSCNLKCIYCYAKKEFSNKIEYKTLINFIKQAQILGAKSVSFVGEGEPFLFTSSTKEKDFLDLITDVNSLGLQSIIYTNATNLSISNAKRLFDMNTVIVAKENGVTQEIQEQLTGKNSFNSIQKGINILKEVGFNTGPNSRLSMHTVATAINYIDIPILWKKWRRENILPQVQIFVPLGISKEIDNKLSLSNEKIKQLFYNLRDIDRKYFGYDWEVRPPIAPHGCNVFYSSCALRPNGDISICAYTDVILGNILEQNLQEILEKEKTKKIRSIDQYLDGQCEKCLHRKELLCYGCRTHQLYKTGNIFSGYESCWNYKPSTKH